ncbi:shikimate kinase [Aquibacillus rhizosphaerae]|uniref:Shikimate kinase n=1 Tax=Aquibacillus rhizosphaerae TaxID=3051431 RepID=A0ABT7L6V4_9BACI|nr:shikimate kinase [Aquibacillus sp. LR5S19]MDL4841561.1 shikimate kinase [Aquibacillus sp. LR5S19]
MKSIYLIGFMGSGKTSVAKRLSEVLHVSLIDTDDLIEETYQTTIANIFAKSGEKTFRDYETDILRKTPIKDRIISTGGGIIERQENIDWLKSNGIVIYLQTSWQEIVHRLKDDSARPIWNNEQRDKKKMLEKRDIKYKETADYIIITDGKTPEMIVNELITLIK